MNIAINGFAFPEGRGLKRQRIWPYRTARIQGRMEEKGDQHRRDQ